MVKNQNWKIVFIASFIVVSLIFLLDNYISNTEDVLYERLEKHVIKDMSNLAINVDKRLKQATNKRINESIFEYFKNQKKIREHFEQEMGLLVNTRLKYLYLIYQDEKQRFRFLADGSHEDRARFNQKLDVENSQYNEIYKTKKELSITQKSLTSLSITFLYPIIEKGEVEAVLVFDFSSAFEYELKKIISPLKNMFVLIYIIVGVFLIVTIVQTFLYYKARKRSYIDALTNCFNRQYLRYFLDTRNIINYQIIMIDFDHFKKINDNYGHNIGDKVLIFGSQLIKSTLSKEDRSFRYGGEEFLVLVHKDNDVNKVAENIRKTIEYAHFVDANINIDLTVSIGVNPIPSHARNTSQAIGIADSMLYHAKTQGRNRVIVYSDGMEVEVEEKQSTPSNIHNVVEALEQDKVICHFHKIIDKNSSVYKYEALVRYIDADGKIVYPNHFLSDISFTKVYVDLTKRVIDICIDTIIKQDVEVSLNLNVNDLLNEVLVQYLIEKVNTLDKEKKSLTIEILENEEIKNMDAIKEIVHNLHEHGIKIAIDDFGSGYASFNYLVDLNVDYIKIDGYLVENSVNSEKSKNIVKSIIGLAHEMKIKTIVEFVSSQEIQDEMLSLGSDYMQGFHISKPQAHIT